MLKSRNNAAWRESDRLDLLLFGGTVITVDDSRRVIENGAVAVAKDRIVAVETADDIPLRARREIDCTGKVVIPGFIDCHTHLFNSLARGLGEGLSLWPWLRDFKWPYNAAINSREASVAATLSAIEAARSGITSVLDHHYAPMDLETTLAIADAIEKVGLRGVVARGRLGAPTEVATGRGLDVEEMFRYSARDELQITRVAIEERPPGGRVAVWPAPVNLTYASQDLVRRSVELAHEFGTGWHTHSSETSSDSETYLARYGLRPIEFLYREGLLGPTTTIAHGIWLDDAEVRAAGETRTGFSYNPISNQYLASGVLRLKDLRSAGAVIGLGTDGPACGHRQDMFEQMKQAILLQKVHTLDATTSTSEEVFELATREGARYLGMDSGILARGKLADITVVDLDQPHLTPCHRPVATLVYAARGSDVVMTIVGGDVIYERGRCMRVDEREAMSEARTLAREAVLRAGLQGLTLPWRCNPE